MGQSNEIFTPSFFHHSNQPEPRTNGLKYFRISFRFCRDTRILVSKKHSARSQKNLILDLNCKNEKCSPFLVQSEHIFVL